MPLILLIHTLKIKVLINFFTLIKIDLGIGSTRQFCLKIRRGLEYSNINRRVRKSDHAYAYSTPIELVELLIPAVCILNLFQVFQIHHSIMFLDTR